MFSVRRLNNFGYVRYYWTSIEVRPYMKINMSLFYLTKIEIHNSLSSISLLVLPFFGIY